MAAYTKVTSTAAPSTTAVSIVAARGNREEVLIQNVGSVIVYLGKDATVTSANGIKLIVDATFRDETSTDAWFAIAASATADLRIVETLRTS